MVELRFPVGLEWPGRGREGAGRIVTDGLELELSTPTSMGGRVGTNPEELLVSAVTSCYAATMLGIIQRTGLPASSVRIDPDGVHEYEQAAADAHDRCFIGGTIAGAVDYGVGPVAVAPAEVPA